MTGLFEESAEEKAFFQAESAAEFTAPEPEPAPEPEVEQESLPESQEESTPEPAKAPEPEKKVDYGALQEERIKRRELEKRLQELEARLQQQQKPAEPEQPAIPDPEADPIAALKYERERREAFEREMHQQRQEAALRNHVESMEAEFVKATPDYQDAVQHLRQHRVTELRYMGITDPQMIANVLRADAQILVQNALQQGVNPASWAYEMARHRGYAKAAPPAPAPVAPPTNKVEQIKSARPAAKSLSGTGGNPGQNLTIEALSGLSDDEFDAAFEKMWRNT